jgi:hypothetical protein
MIGIVVSVGLPPGEWRLDDGVWVPERRESIDWRLVEGDLVLLSDGLVCILWCCEDWCDEQTEPCNLGLFYINMWRGKIPNIQVSQIFLLGGFAWPEKQHTASVRFWRLE